jgi:hypothetical protein
MARRKIASFTYASQTTATDDAIEQQRKAVVYYDAQWQDNIVEYERNGVRLKGASSHHYDDREDAMNTARSYASGRL